MRLQRWSGLSLIDAVCLHRDELVKNGAHYRVDTNRRKTGVRVQVPVPRWLGEELLGLARINADYFFWSGMSTPKSARSWYDKLCRKVFAESKVKAAGSHRFRHRFAVALLEAGVDIRMVSKLLGHKSLAVTERFYAAWSKKQQTAIEQEVTKAWAHKDASHI